MNIKEIQNIINFIKKTDLDDVSIETENYKIRVKKNNTEVTQLKEKMPVEIENDETKPVSPLRRNKIRNTLNKIP